MSIKHLPLYKTYFIIFVLTYVWEDKQTLSQIIYKIYNFFNVLENMAMLDSKSFMTAFVWICAQYVESRWYMLFHQPLEIFAFIAPMQNMA